MTISFSWLKEFIDITETPEEIGAILTSTGLEVESISTFDTVQGGLKGVVIGTVKTCQKHPNADKLSVTTVSVGGANDLPIVCGAPNVAAGQRVAVALPGTTLYPFNGEPITLRSTKIRGEVSEGMICALDELGLGADHDGIVVLNTDFPDGTPAAGYFNIHTDQVFEIGLTPNRADAASHMGVARDLKAALNRNLKLPSVNEFKAGTDKGLVTVRVEDTNACIRYSGVSIQGVQVTDSPEWLKNRLTAIGLSPINNIVDVTNFVLHELGQPLHAFDADKIRGQEVIVKCLPPGTSFVTLDGKERKLSGTDLMICDQVGGMCIAGVFGGMHSGVSDQTTSVFLESACFTPGSVRKTSMLHQLVTDASFRFARGTDPELTTFALKRAALLIQAVAGGTIVGSVTDIYPEPVQPKTFQVRDALLNRLIGQNLDRSVTFPILKNLDIDVKEFNSEIFEVTVPAYRVDVTQAADIAEEILRIYGFNNIPLGETVGAEFLADFPVRDPDKYRRILSELLCGQGFFEILTNSLTSEHYNAKNNFTLENRSQVTILNKLSEEQGALRQTLLFTGLESVAWNINRKAPDLKLFEFGKVYWLNDRTDSPEASKKYQEADKLGIFMTGLSEPETWITKSHESSYADLAQVVSDILQRANLSKIRQEKLNHSCMEYGMMLTRGKETAGFLGKVKASVCKNFGIKQAVFYAELDVAMLCQSMNPRFEIEELPKFPKVRRDLSLVLDTGIDFSQIKEVIQQTEKKLIREIQVFDVYEGKNLQDGKKAYAVAFTLQDEAKTLTDTEIDQVMERLIKNFEQKLGAVIRK